MKPRADGRWQKKITLPNGKPKLFYSSAPTEQKAIKDINKQILEFSLKEHQEKHNFKTLAERMIETKEKTVGGKTLEGYNLALKHLQCFWDKDIEDISPSDIQSVLNRMALQRYSQSSIQKVKITFGLVLDFAIMDGLKISNFMRSVKVPKSASKKKISAVDDSTISIITENKDICHGMWAYILLYTGMRRGELAALQKKDIDFKNSYINVWRAAEYVNNQASLKETTKSMAGVRKIPILNILYAPLYEFTKDMKSDDFIFGGTTPLSKTMLRKRWLSYCKEINQDITQHQLRHSYAKILYRAGVDAKTAQGLLGHSDILTTMNIYTDFSNDVTEKSILQVNNFIKQVV